MTLLTQKAHRMSVFLAQWRLIRDKVFGKAFPRQAATSERV